jgi:hypothetical protein
VGPVHKPLCHDLRLVTGGAILEKLGGLVDPHEKFQLVLKHPWVSLAVHHLPLLEELQPSPALPAETSPDHHLCWMFDRLLGEFGVESVQPHRPHAAAMLVPKMELKVALI